MIAVFDGLTGQETVKSRLADFMNNICGQVFVFSGPKGIGRYTFAREFASLLLCDSPSNNTPCGNCKSCKCFAEDSHPDYKEILPVNKTIRTDDVRKQLVTDIYNTPFLSKRKVYYISGDYLNEQSQNVMLKTLENPPEYAIIIIAVTSEHIILPTVLSRSVLLQFQRYSAEEIKEILDAKNIHLGKETDFFISMSEGIPGKVLDMAEKEGLIDLRESISELLFDIHSQKSADVFTRWFPVFNENKDDFMYIHTFLSSLLRDGAIIARGVDNGADNGVNHGVEHGVDDNKLLNIDKVREINDFVKNLNADYRGYLNSVNHCDKCANEIKMNGTYEISVSSMLLNIRRELVNDG